MPKQLPLYQVLLSSPSDLKDERAAVREVAEEINLGDHGFRIEIVGWETHAAPGMGEDAQEVVQRDIPEDYDVYLGLMWTRFGTPTKRAGSGTEDEFRDALERFRVDGRPSIMVYFKKGGVNPLEVDPKQLRKVQEFRKALMDEGALVKTFEDPEDLAQQVRLHLLRRVRKMEEEEAEPSLRAQTEQIKDLEEEQDEEGFLDLLDRGEAGFERSAEVLNLLTEEISNLGDKVEDRAAEVDQLPRPVERNAARRISDRITRDMMGFASSASDLLPNLTEANSDAFESLTKAVALYKDFTSEDVAPLCEALANVRELRANADGAAEGVASFRDAFDEIPRLTSGVILARRRAAKVVEHLLEEIDRVLRLTEEAEEAIEATLHELDKNCD